MEHQRHQKLPRPFKGRYARKEWAILGANCTTIQHLARTILAALQPQFRCGYLDADHAAADNPEMELPGMLSAGATISYLDAIRSHQWQSSGMFGDFQLRQVLNQMDLVLVNGNHREASAQVVIVDPQKETSLKKRLPQLTQVELLLLADGVEKPFDFLTAALPSLETIPMLSLHDHAGIQQFFTTQMLSAIPKLNGLVLAGGRSVRMGQDKGAISWHGKPQREYAADLLAAVCDTVYVSCRPDQQAEMTASYPVLVDSFLELGPFGGLLSAFREAPDRAWLVMACDLPLVQPQVLQTLEQNRSAKHLATAFISASDGMPEPLITIWEPKSYGVMLSFLSQGYSCPRKVLMQSDVHLIPAPDASVLTNVNTPEELAFWQKNMPNASV
jgi:molybdopterin-guanine dinucleotide biosynthesis protein A